MPPLLPITAPNQIFTTFRLKLRPLTPADLPDYHALRSSPAVMKYSRTHLPDASLAATWEKLAPLIAPDPHSTFPNTWDNSWTLGIELLHSPDPPTLVGDLGVWHLDFVSEEPASDGDEGHWDAELGYMLAESCWGQGYMTEALGAYLRAFADMLEERKRSLDGLGKLAPVHVKAVTEEANVGSHRVLVKCGFLEGRRWVNEENGDRLLEMVYHCPAVGGREG